MAATDKRAPERKCREGVAGISERGDKDAELRGLAQSASARSRSIAARRSLSWATGVTISVPTPASR